MLTVPECDSAKSGESIYRLKDSPNLFLVVYPSGRKSWEYRYQEQGKSKALILGEYGNRAPGIGPRTAREKRDAIATQRSARRDPILGRKLEKERQKHELDEARIARLARQAEKARKRLEAERGAI